MAFTCFGPSCPQDSTSSQDLETWWETEAPEGSGGGYTWQDRAYLSMSLLALGPLLHPLQLLFDPGELLVQLAPLCVLHTQGLYTTGLVRMLGSWTPSASPTQCPVPWTLLCSHFTASLGHTTQSPALCLARPGFRNPSRVQPLQVKRLTVHRKGILVAFGLQNTHLPAQEEGENSGPERGSPSSSQAQHGPCKSVGSRHIRQCPLQPPLQDKWLKLILAAYDGACNSHAHGPGAW